jgi:hypothetical protein
MRLTPSTSEFGHDLSAYRCKADAQDAGCEGRSATVVMSQSPLRFDIRKAAILRAAREQTVLSAKTVGQEAGTLRERLHLALSWHEDRALCGEWNQGIAISQLRRCAIHRVSPF